MTVRVPHLQAMALVLALVVLAGCPFTPQLLVTPGALAFGAASVTKSIVVDNAGGGKLSWQVQELSRANEEADWVVADVSWLSVTPGSGTTQTELDRVFVNAARAGQAVGEYRNAALQITSNGGTVIVPVSMDIEPTLLVTPEALALSAGQTSAQFTVVNTGTAAAVWEVLYLEDPDNHETAASLPDDLLVTPNPGTTAAGQNTPVTVNWAEGREDFYLLVQSVAGTAAVSFLFGSGVEGLSVSPDVLTLYVDDSETGEGETAVEQAATTLTIANTGSEAHSWTMEVVSLVNPLETPAIGVNPSTGQTLVGEESKVAVKVTDPGRIVAGSGNYDLLLRSEGSFLRIPVIIEIMRLPEIALSEPPQTSSSRPEIIPIGELDFGRDKIQATFWIANVGPRGSYLYFDIVNGDAALENPVIVEVNPSQGGANGEDGNSEDYFHPELDNVMIDGREITVTIDRNNLQEDVEYHALTVRATDIDYANTLDAVEEKTLQIRVERPPMTVEGAINRSRPPYVMRFVFLLRDTLGKVIPTRSQEELGQVSFTVQEDGHELDLDETSLFITGPDNLRVNLVLMLDYTGSMYNAGVDDAVNPLEPGEALEHVKEAAKKFLDDLPASYRVALMYYFDRQQPSRLLHAFSTDRNVLKASIDAFVVPYHGVSDIRDAVKNGIDVLAAEDSADTLPFDEADVRSVVFISDGVDNASIAAASDVTDAAREARVRLYPLGYNAGNAVNSADLVVMANDTGGHFYNAGSAENLAKLLSSDKSLSLELVVISAENRVYFDVVNSGKAIMTWSAAAQEGVNWMADVLPAGGDLQPGAHATVSVRVDPSGIGANQTAIGDLIISSNDGSGTATVRVDVGADPSVAQSVTVALQDEPGLIWNELRNQIVLTYVTPQQEGGKYSIRAEYKQPDATTIAGIFEEDAVFYHGDVRGGQVAMSTTGIYTDPVESDPNLATRAEVYVRTDYVPRNVTRMAMRFFLGAPPNLPLAEAALRANAQMNVELAPGGLLVSDDPFRPSWRLLQGSDGVYNVLTSQDNPLPYGAFGNLLKITITGLHDFVHAFDGLSRQPEFFVEMRMDNQIYVSPETPTHPSKTVYFLYPAGPTFPDRKLSVSTFFDNAPPARNALLLADPGISPEAEHAWDRDEDGLPDFNDPYPDRDDLPGVLAVPNPLEITSSDTQGVFTLRNNRLDTFAWSLVPASLPSWVTNVLYGDALAPAGDAVLAPGESETIHLIVDRTGLPSGYTQAVIPVQTDIFGTEYVLTTLIVP